MCAVDASGKKDADEYRGGVHDNKDIGEYLWNLARIMENAPTPFAMCYDDGRIMNCNHAFTELTGYTKDKLYKLAGLQALTPQKYYAADAAETEALHASGQPRRYEKEIIRQDGSRVCVDVFYHLVGGGNGKPKFYYFFMSDASKRIRLEEELKQVSAKSERLASELDVVLLSLTESVVVYDANSIALRANPAAVACLGFNPAGMGINELNRRVSFRYPDGQMVTVDESPQLLAIHGDKAACGRFKLTDKGGRDVLIVLSASPFYFKGRVNGAICIWQDVTEHERMLEQAEKERRLLQDSKMQTELYFDLMSHDIININQVGMGYLELALDRIKPDEELYKLLQKSFESFLNSSKLIDNVGKIKRAQSTEAPLEAIDVGELLGDVRKDFLVVNGREISISYEPVKGCYVMANDLLKDIFSNILGNSVKHSSGLISVGISISRAFENGQAYFKVAIEDNGPGIPDELKGRIFIRFQRNMTKARGKGIGLYLVKSLLEGFHGRIWVEDRVPGEYTKGSRFVVMLPAVMYD